MSGRRRFYGIEQPLDDLVSTHLFILCPNNSGSTFLKNAFWASENTWNLRREGQHIHGYVGPRSAQRGRQLLWAAKPEWAADFHNPASFDWDKNRLAWYSQSFALSANASVFVEKTPPFLLIPDQLAAAFKNPKFVVAVRNPYAAFEGIIRRRTTNSPPGEAAPARLAAQHLVACFAQQATNLATLGSNMCSFTYEEMCADPIGSADRIKALVPELDDLDLDQRISVKGTHDEQLRNMNDDQIRRLTAADIDVATSVFGEHEELLTQFGYELM